MFKISKIHSSFMYIGFCVCSASGTKGKKRGTRPSMLYIYDSCSCRKSDVNDAYLVWEVLESLDFYVLKSD